MMVLTSLLPISQLPELDVPMGPKGQKGKDNHIQTKLAYFDKMSATLGTLANRTWFGHYQHSQYSIYNNRSEFKLPFVPLCDSYGLPTSVKTHNKIQYLSECIKQSQLLYTAKIYMVDTIIESVIADFLTNAGWAVCSTYHTVIKTLPGVAIFGRDMLFDMSFIADWSEIEEYRNKHRQKHRKRKNAHVN